ncbi:hypothetical protein V8E53_004700 [Lactarius tabidus]
MRFSHNDELTRPSYCRVRMDAIEGGSMHAERRAIATQLPRRLSHSLSRVSLCPTTIPIEPPRGRLPARIPSGRTSVIRTNRADGFSWYIAPSNVSFVAFTTSPNGTILGGYAVLPQDIRTVDVHIGGAKHVARLQRDTLIGLLSPELTLNVFTGRMAPYVEEYCRLVAPGYC